MPRRPAILLSLLIAGGAALPFAAEEIARAQPAAPSASSAKPAPPASSAVPSSSAAKPPPAPSASAAPAPAPPAPSGDGKDQNPADAAPSADKAAEARIHFDKGVALAKSGANEAGLAELLESRRLYPTRNATYNAAVLLRQLQRFDESLSMYEALLREFPDLPADTKATAQREVVELRGLVGTIEIDGAELGAGVSIDGRSRGDYPLLEPLRVPAGSHVVRVYKEGFEPFETRVDLAGGKRAVVAATLRPLRSEEIGRLQVVELGGKELDVLVDGVVVGKTPRWEGPVAVGSHTVVLRGEGDLGTQPVSVPVKLRQTTPLSLSAEALGAVLQVKPTPAGASVAIDAVVVGRGIWEGRLKIGVHRIEVSSEGFLPASKQVSLDRDRREVVTVALDRDPSSVRWRKPARFFVELDGAAALAQSYGGEIGSTCGDGCSLSRGTAIGGYGAFHGGYELGSGFGFGIVAGYFRAREGIDQHNVKIDIVSDAADPRGDVSDKLVLSGALFGVWAGLSLGERFPVRLRLGAGAVAGSIIDSRTGAIAKPHEALGRRGISRSANFFWTAPEVRIAFPIGAHFEISAGIEALVLVSFSPPRWQKDTEENLYVYAGSRGAAQFPADEIIGRAMLLIAPGVGARYSF